MGDKMDLSSYLLKPVQRMGKYALILKQVLKECPENSPDYQELQSAEEMIRFCLQHGNDLLAMDALQVKSLRPNMQEIMTCGHCDVRSLQCNLLVFMTADAFSVLFVGL